MTTLEAFNFVEELNRKKYEEFLDWRLLYIRELESLVDCNFHTPA
ncbi:DUF1566 domain-containing protein [Thermodesulfobacterium hydrogeniphilum]|nr:DUF1566 domain-containing protein [Thermodesulfobacterium hydrogeniphilum]